MSRRIILTAILMSAFSPVLPAAEPKSAAPEPSPAAAANAIAFKLYAGEASKPGNIFFSPYSIREAFALAYEGAGGRTAKEIRSVFSFPAKAAELRRSLAALKKDLAVSSKGAEFSQANSFWAQENYKFLPAYLKTLSTYYGAEARQADFSGKTEEARGAINAWTETRTKGKIKELFPEGALTPLSRLVLVNAVYFKGTWVEQFDKDMTYDADFAAGGEKVKVKMMSAAGTRRAEYTGNDELQALRLPYKGGGLSMLVLLPREGKALADTEKGLDGEKLESIRKSLSREKVKVFFPKFTFNTGYTLNDALAGLGMPSAFNETADFSGMDGTSRLYIQKAFHKAFVEVNEEGTEAAAATGVAMGMKSMAFDIVTFRANRPFLFFIEDSKTGLILFMGRMEKPQSSR